MPLVPDYRTQKQQPRTLGGQVAQSASKYLDKFIDNKQEADRANLMAQTQLDATGMQQAGLLNRKELEMAGLKERTAETERGRKERQERGFEHELEKVRGERKRTKMKSRDRVIVGKIFDAVALELTKSPQFAKGGDPAEKIDMAKQLTLEKLVEIFMTNRRLTWRQFR